MIDPNDSRNRVIAQGINNIVVTYMGILKNPKKSEKELYEAYGMKIACELLIGTL